MGVDEEMIGWMGDWMLDTRVTEGGCTEVFSDGGAVRVCSGEVRRMRGLGEWMDDWVVEWVVGWIVLVERWLFRRLLERLGE